MIMFVDFTRGVTRFALVAAMGNLALYYNSIGRHKDALVLEEKVLEFYRRAMPSDDPCLGSMHSAIMTSDLTGVSYFLFKVQQWATLATHSASSGVAKKLSCW